MQGRWLCGASPSSPQPKPLCQDWHFHYQHLLPVPPTILTSVPTNCKTKHFSRQDSKVLCPNLPRGDMALHAAGDTAAGGIMRDNW